MNRRKFLRNSFVLTALGAVSQNIWADPMMGRAQLFALPQAPLHIRHGLLQVQSAKALLPNCRWLLGLQQNSFLRNGLEAGEQPFRHFDIALAETRLGIGVQGEQLWLCDEKETMESQIPSAHQFGDYHLTFERLIGAASFSPPASHNSYLLMPLSGHLLSMGSC